MEKDPTISVELRNEVQRDIEKLIYINNYFEWVNRLVDVFENHEIFNLVPKIEGKKENNEN